MDINARHPHLAANLVAAVARSPYRHHGVRVEAGRLANGTALPPSRRWEDGRLTDDVLPGTSVLYLDERMDVAAVRRLLDLAGHYDGSHLVLVGCDAQADGACEDAGERLLRAPWVLASLELGA